MRIFLLTLLIPTAVFAKISPADPAFNGAGGKAVWCSGEMRQAEMLDLWEARQSHGLREVPQKLDFRDEVRSSLERLEAVWNLPQESSLAASSVDERLKSFYSHMRFIPRGKHLKVLNDTHIPILPRNCVLVQVAVFDRAGLMHVDRNEFKKLDARNKTVLLLHEELARTRKAFSRSDSEETRRFLAALFSNHPPRPRFWDVPATGYYDCKSKDFRFFIYPASRSRHLGYVASFRRLGEVRDLGRIAAPFEDAKLFYGLQNEKARVLIQAPLFSQSRNEKRLLTILKAKNSSQVTVSLADRHGRGAKTLAPGSCEFR
jgi:hypothetical protein